MNDFIKNGSAREDDNETFIENIPDGLQTGKPLNLTGRATLIESPPPSCDVKTNYAAGFVTLNGEVYQLIKQLEVFSAESDIFLIEKRSAEKSPAGEKFILKHYRFGIKPKDEIIEILKSLPRNSVVEIAGHGLTGDGRFYEIQPYFPAGSLRDHLKKTGRASEEFIKEFIESLNGCLYEIHSRNVIHRDIKPDNILIKSLTPLQLVLADFGISSVSETALHQTNMNRTISYSSPESMSGVISRATDYWSLGLIALELILNRHPFESIDDKTLIYWLATRPVPGVERAGIFTELIKGLLTRNPDKRWGYNEIKSFLASPQEKIINYFEEDGLTGDLEPAAASSGERPDRRAYKCRPYKFSGRDYYTLEELSVAMALNHSLAMADFASGRLRNWISRELRDEHARFLIEDLAADTSAGPDEKLFEFFCRVSRKFPFIYKGVLVNFGWLADTALKILRREASEDETALFGELADVKIIEKYYEISGDENLYKCLEPIAEDLKRTAGDNEKRARIILASYSKPYKEKIEGKIRNALRDNVIIKPFAAFGFGPGGETDDASIEKTAEKLKAIADGGPYTLLELVEAAETPQGCLISKSSLEEAYNDFKKNVDGYFRNVGRGEFAANARKYLGQAGPAADPESVYRAIFQLYERGPEYSHKFYGRLSELNGLLLAYKRKSEALTAPTLRVILGENVFLELVRVPAGSFIMGCEDGFDDEKPVHGVTITRPFYVGKYPLTQRQWEKLMGANPSYFKRGGDYPVEKISWNDCVEFISRLNAINAVEGIFRLPSEAEWEYAARGGCADKYYWGADPALAGDHCWHRGNSNLETHICGQKLPNGFGLFDTAGNVREWCGDWYAPYGRGEAVNPQGPRHGNLRVARGGDWSYDAADCTCSGRDYLEPAFRDANLGFRLLLNV